MAQGLQKLATTLVKDPDGAVVATTNHPVSVQRGRDLQGYVVANRMAERLLQDGRHTGRYAKRCIRVDASD